MDEPNQPDWILFNVQETGYYRVNYDEQNWNALITALKLTHSTIHAVNRAQLLDDSHNLAKYGYLSFNTSLDLFTYLRNETELVPFMAALPALDFITKMMRGINNYTDIEEYGRYLLRPIFKKIIKKPDLSHTEKLLRMNIVKYGCRFGLEECLAYAMANLNDVDLDVREGVYCGAAKVDALESMKHMMARWVSITKNGEERYKNLEEVNELIDSIGCYEDEIMMSGWITFSHYLDSNITIDDRRRIFTSVVQGSNMGTTVALAYLTTNYTDLRASYGPLQSIWITIANHITTEEQRDMYFGVLLNNNVDETEEGPSVAMGKQLIDDNLNWIGKNKDEIFNWIEEFNQIKEDDKEDVDDGGGGASIKPLFSLILITIMMLLRN